MLAVSGWGARRERLIQSSTSRRTCANVSPCSRSRRNVTWLIARTVAYLIGRGASAQPSLSMAEFLSWKSLRSQQLCLRTPGRSSLEAAEDLVAELGQREGLASSMAGRRSSWRPGRSAKGRLRVATINLTADELAAVIATVRRAIETDRYRRAPRSILDPLRAALAKLEGAPPSPTPAAKGDKRARWP